MLPILLNSTNTHIIMKKALLLLPFLILGFFNVSAQVDTVCAGDSGISYWLNGTTGSSYAWTVNGGTQDFGGNGDSITIDFSSTPGTDTLTVLETDSNGCIGDPVILVITRVAPPTATIAAAGPLCHNDSTTLDVSITGTYTPWDLTYNDGSGNTTVTVTSSPYTISTSALTTTTTYTLVSVIDRHSCATTLSGAGTAQTVTVYPDVVTPAIQHN